ncbi:MAG: hypothetical protein OXI01_20535 [Albidovulum sp.]|nr:hypothetical protein [Albidovulum sp.]
MAERDLDIGPGSSAQKDDQLTVLNVSKNFESVNNITATGDFGRHSRLMQYSIPMT